MVLVPLVSKDVAQLEHVRKVYLKEAAIIAVLSPLSYVLILYAMKNAPVSLISPLRQFSIVIGATLGIKILCESKEYLNLAVILISIKPLLFQIIGVFVLSKCYNRVYEFNVEGAHLGTAERSGKILF